MKQTVTIYEYNNYRIFLKDTFDSIKANKPQISQRFIANKLGYKSSGAISLILSGKKNISLEKAHSFASFVGLNKEETDYFKLLVQFNQTKSESEEKYLLLSLAEFKNSHFATIDLDRYEFFNHWYHSVVREVIGLHPGITSAKDISRLVTPPITELQAQTALDLLEKLQFIRQNENGGYERAEPVVTTGKTMDSSVIKKYNHEMIRLGLVDPKGTKKGDRSNSSLMLSVSEKTYFTMLEEMREFRKRLLHMAQEDVDPERVYQFNFQTYPLTK